MGLCFDSLPTYREFDSHLAFRTYNRLSLQNILLKKWHLNTLCIPISISRDTWICVITESLYWSYGAFLVGLVISLIGSAWVEWYYQFASPISTWYPSNLVLPGFFSAFHCLRVSRSTFYSASTKRLCREEAVDKLHIWSLHTGATGQLSWSDSRTYISPSDWRPPGRSIPATRCW